LSRCARRNDLTRDLTIEVRRAAPARGVVRGAHLGDGILVIPGAPVPRAIDAPRPVATNVAGREPDVAEIMSAARRQAQRVLDEAEAAAARLREEAAAVLADAPRQLEAARRELAELRAALATEADRTLASARAEGHALGYAEGMEQGRQEGIAQVRAELGAHLERLAGVANEAAVTREEIVRAAEADLARLAIDVAERIIRREIAADPMIVAGLVETAVATAGATGPVRIRVNPDDWEFIGEYWANDHAVDADRYEFVVDQRIHPGGVVVDVRSGSVDAQIETQLDEVRKAFFE
jgi:flagellar assembly protein FliH